MMVSVASKPPKHDALPIVVVTVALAFTFRFALCLQSRVVRPGTGHVFRGIATSLTGPRCEDGLLERGTDFGPRLQRLSTQESDEPATSSRMASSWRMRSSSAPRYSVSSPAT